VQDAAFEKRMQESSDAEQLFSSSTVADAAVQVGLERFQKLQNLGVGGRHPVQGHQGRDDQVQSRSLLSRETLTEFLDLLKDWAELRQDVKLGLGGCGLDELVDVLVRTVLPHFNFLQSRTKTENRRHAVCHRVPPCLDGLDNPAVGDVQLLAVTLDDLARFGGLVSGCGNLLASDNQRADAWSAGKRVLDGVVNEMADAADVVVDKFKGVQALEHRCGRVCDGSDDVKFLTAWKVHELAKHRVANVFGVGGTSEFSELQDKLKRKQNK